MAAAYLSVDEAHSRLAELGYEAQLTEGELRLASAIVDGYRPFKDTAPQNQMRQFPRGGDEEVPDDVLDAVVLTAYADNQDMADVPVTSESVGDVSVSYARPSVSKVRKHAHTLLRPYMKTGGKL